MACYDLRSAVIVVIALPLIPLFMMLIGLITADRSAASLHAMTTLQSTSARPRRRHPHATGAGPSRRTRASDRRTRAAHRRSAMATLRIAFLSALVLELLATLGVALVAVSVGLRLVSARSLSTAPHRPAAGTRGLLATAPGRCGVPRRPGREDRRDQGRSASRRPPASHRRASVAWSQRERPSASTTSAWQVVTARRRTGCQRCSLPGRHRPDGPERRRARAPSLHVILGLTPPTSGRVLVGGVDVTELDPRAWWAQRRVADAAARR